MHGFQDLEKFGYAVEIGTALVNSQLMDVLLVSEECLSFMDALNYI